MKTLIVATRNAGKLREIRELLEGLPIQIVSLADYRNLPEIIEDGKTFRANAVKKALTISSHTGTLVLGEDSGIEVRAIGNAPGVYSARYAGPRATDKKNNVKLLRALRGAPGKDRAARYRCAAALSEGRVLIATVCGTCEGVIAGRARGKNGFGYDPLFLIPKYQKTFGQLDPAIKAAMSHRGKAMKKIRKILESYLSKTL